MKVVSTTGYKMGGGGLKLSFKRSKGERGLPELSNANKGGGGVQISGSL